MSAIDIVQSREHYEKLRRRELRVWVEYDTMLMERLLPYMLVREGQRMFEELQAVRRDIDAERDDFKRCCFELVWGGKLAIAEVFTLGKVSAQTEGRSLDLLSWLLKTRPFPQNLSWAADIAGVVSGGMYGETESAPERLESFVRETTDQLSTVADQSSVMHHPTLACLLKNRDLVSLVRKCLEHHPRSVPDRGSLVRHVIGRGLHCHLIASGACVAVKGERSASKGSAAHARALVGYLSSISHDVFRHLDEAVRRYTGSVSEPPKIGAVSSIDFDWIVDLLKAFQEATDAFLMRIQHEQSWEAQLVEVGRCSRMLTVLMKPTSM